MLKKMKTQTQQRNNRYRRTKCKILELKKYNNHNLKLRG